MIHYGDITQLKVDNLPIVDIITGGSPCQDLSVAGKREGLAGERSGLFMEQIRIVKEMREHDRRTTGRTDEHIRPRFMVWENVPGAFSSNKGEDFRIVLEEIAKVAERDACIPGPPNKGKWTPSGCIMGNGWSIAWRVHDAQFWGVPQRRKRIALVADFGGETAPEILFERKGLSRDITESKEQGQGTTTDAERSVGETSESLSFQERAGKEGGGKGILIQNERTGALSTLNNQSVLCIQGNCIDRSDTAGCNGKGWRENESYTLNTIDRHAADSRVKIREDGMVQTLSSRMGTGGGNVPMVMEQPITASKASYFMKQHDDGVAETLVATDYKDPQLVAYGLDRAAYNQGQNAKFGFSVDEEKVGAQTAKGPGAVCSAVDCRNGVEDADKNGSLQSRSSNNINSNNVCRVGSVVRRLTPLECERLQGFPDHWTDIGDWVDSKGKKHKGESDSPRYKALGNSIALPFWVWMAERMVSQLNVENPTMASLFDGIGGFPLVYSRCGCVPVWASEIEEFPIAVTKLRFGEE